MKLKQRFHGELDRAMLAAGWARRDKTTYARSVAQGVDSWIVVNVSGTVPPLLSIVSVAVRCDDVHHLIEDLRKRKYRPNSPATFGRTVQSLTPDARAGIGIFSVLEDDVAQVADDIVETALLYGRPFWDENRTLQDLAKSICSPWYEPGTSYSRPVVHYLAGDLERARESIREEREASPECREYAAFAKRFASTSRGTPHLASDRSDSGVGYAVSWLAVRGVAPAMVLKELGLRRTDDREDFPESDLVGVALPSGWYVVHANEFHSSLTSRKNLQRLSSTGGRVVVCMLEEHIMYSEAREWRDSREVWSLVRDCQKGSSQRDARGDLPPCYGAVRSDLEAAQASESSRVDHLIDIPIGVAGELTGFWHDRDLDGLQDEPFEVLE